MQASSTDEKSTSPLVPSTPDSPSDMVEQVVHKDTVHYMSRSGFSKESFNENDPSDRVRIHHDDTVKLVPRSEAAIELNSNEMVSVPLSLKPPVDDAVHMSQRYDDNRPLSKSADPPSQAMEPVAWDRIIPRLAKAACYCAEALLVIMGPIHYAIMLVGLSMLSHSYPQLAFLGPFHLCIPFLLFVTLGLRLYLHCKREQRELESHKDDVFDMV